MARLDYFAPGVYVEEVDRGSRPIEGISMSVAGFVGLTEEIRGGAQRLQPMLVSNWNQYLEYFARPGSNGFTDFNAYLPFAVRGWFENGGGRCWVVSLGTQLPNVSGEQSNANGTAPTPFSLANATIIPTVSGHPSLSTSIKPERTDLDRVSMIIEPDVPRPLIERPAIERSTDEPVDEFLFDPEDKFQIKVIQGERILEGPYRHLSMDSEVDPTMGEFVGTALQASSIIDLAILANQGSPLWQKPANGIYEVAKYELVPHADLDRDISGQRSDRTGIRGLFEIDEVSMIACPDLMLAHREGLINLDQVHSIMDLMITGCETAVPSPKYRMAVLDLPPVQPDRSTRAVSAEQQKPQHAMQWLNEFGRRSDMAAIYYPWIKVANPRDQGRPILVPPCGHMMGIWCHTDETRGVHKAPANVQPRGVIGMAYEVNFREQELLNPLGINCIRRFPNRGIRVWGARTLIEPDNVQYLTAYGAMSPSQVRQALLQILQTLMFLHSQRWLESWRKGIAHGNLSLDSLLIANQGINPDETAAAAPPPWCHFWIYVTDLLLWQQWFHPPDQLLPVSSIAEVDQLKVKDLQDLGQIAMHLLLGDDSDRSPNKLNSTQRQRLAALTDKPLIYFMDRLTGRSSESFKTAEAAYQALLKLPLEQPSAAVKTEAEPDNLPTQLPRRLLLLLAVIPLIIGLLGISAWIVRRLIPPPSSPDSLSTICCINQVDIPGKRTMTYLATSHGSWYRSLIQPGLVAEQYTLIEALQARDPRLNNYQIRPSITSSLDDINLGNETIAKFSLEKLILS